jgi:hypothetical protein
MTPLSGSLLFIAGASGFAALLACLKLAVPLEEKPPTSADPAGLRRLPSTPHRRRLGCRSCFTSVPRRATDLRYGVVAGIRCQTTLDRPVGLRCSRRGV